MFVLDAPLRAHSDSLQAGIHPQCSLHVDLQSPRTRDEHSRTGRDLLESLCEAHPFAISDMLEMVNIHFEQLGKVRAMLHLMFCSTDGPCQLPPPGASVPPTRIVVTLAVLPVFVCHNLPVGAH